MRTIFISQRLPWIEKKKIQIQDKNRSFRCYRQNNFHHLWSRCWEDSKQICKRSCWKSRGTHQISDINIVNYWSWYKINCWYADWYWRRHAKESEKSSTKKIHLPTPFEWIQSKGWFWKLHSCKDIWWAFTWHKGMSKQNHTQNNKLL